MEKAVPQGQSPKNKKEENVVVKPDTQPGRSIPTERLGPVLREWRKRRGLSQAELASRIGAAKQQAVVSRVETGSIPKICPGDVGLLAKALGIPEDYLIKGVFPWNVPDAPTTNNNLESLSTPELFKLLHRVLSEIEHRTT